MPSHSSFDIFSGKAFSLDNTHSSSVIFSVLQVITLKALVIRHRVSKLFLHRLYALISTILGQYTSNFVCLQVLIKRHLKTDSSHTSYPDVFSSNKLHVAHAPTNPHQVPS